METDSSEVHSKSTSKVTEILFRNQETDFQGVLIFEKTPQRCGEITNPRDTQNLAG